MAATSMPVRGADGQLREVAQEENAGVRTPRFAPEVGGAAVSPSNPLPVQGPVTDAQMRAAALPTADAGLGTDGATPPSIAGTGVRGWLRAIYERLVAGIGVTGPATDAQLRAAPLPTADASLGTDGTTPPAIAGTGVRGWLRAIYERLVATLSVSDAENRAVQGAVALTVGGALVAPGRSIYILATASGLATLTLADGSTIQIEVAVGGQQLSFAVRGVAAGAATGTYYSLI